MYEFKAIRSVAQSPSRSVAQSLILACVSTVRVACVVSQRLANRRTASGDSCARWSLQL